jgi:membrane-bound lytic murein transglycosylase A
MRLRNTAWAQRCQELRSISPGGSASIRNWIESRFTPYLLSDSKGTRSATITGYYEPVVKGSRTRGGPFQVPLYQTPKDLVNVDLSSVYPEIKALRLRGRLEGNRLTPYPTRAEIEKNRLLEGLELVWLDDPIDAFFLQVQGSGRVELPNGESIRVGYAEQNGHPYRSIGRYLIDQGELKANEASMQGIRAWLARNPHRRDELLHQNPSVVFFKEIRQKRAPGEPDGPLGSMGIPLSAERSIAVDPRFVEAGTLVFLSTRVPAGSAGGTALAGQGAADKPFRQLMIAQDSGSAIVGVHRGDIFFGSGPAAGETAGRMRAQGTMVLLLPNP